ncbi:hypothetical protein [Streptomyces sp. NPDC051211]|uniref:hypothetical protein n=1 Tax=Streptomyces sp. NPDC051211 TaxID=3154643 RepID=UPI00344B16AA
MEFVEVEDVPGRALRRDYGLLELYFSADGRAGWALTGGMLQVHRLAGEPELAAGWRRAVGADFAPSTAWVD